MFDAKRLVWIALAAVLATGCGSTVPGAAQLATSNDATGDPSLSSQSEGLNGSLSAPDAVRGSDQRRTPSIGASPILTTPGGSSARAQFSRGVTGSQIKIGRVRIENGEAFNRALGINVSPGDPDLYEQIMLDHINSTGGIAGRKVKLVHYTVDATAPPPPGVADQESCELWTRDDPVYLAMVGGSDSLKACMAKAAVPLMSSGTLSGSDEQSFRRFPSVLLPNTMNLNRRAKIYAEGLLAQRFFESKSKIGLVSFDTPEVHRAVDGTLKTTLRAKGHRISEEHYLKYPESQAELGQEAASFSNIVLRFKSAGIDRVLIIDLTGGGVMIFFGRNAEAQDYHPRYGLESSSFPQFQIDTDTVDPSQFRGAVGVGWTPLSDVGPTKPHGPGYRRCEKIMADGGADFGTNDNARGIGMLTCDGFFFLKQAVEAGLPSINLSSFVAGAESLGDSYLPSMVPAVRVGPGRHDGLSAVRHFAFDERCTCFKYTTGLLPAA